MNPSTVAAEQEPLWSGVHAARTTASRRAYWREAKARSRAAIRQWDPRYDRSPRLDRQTAKPRKTA